VRRAGSHSPGPCSLGLAAAWWSTAQRLPEKNDQRMAAANNLASALASQNKHEEAETMFRLLLATVRRVRGPEHERTLSASMNLANVLDSQGKHLEAETTYRELLTVQQRVMGPEHPNTLLIAINLARGLQSRGKNAEAETLYRDTLPLQRRVSGPEHPDTLRTAGTSLVHSVHEASSRKPKTCSARHLRFRIGCLVQSTRARC
jgi:tetratricopeptide (TPR) repeat protein